MNVPSHPTALAFYAAALGLPRDPGELTGSVWMTVGSNQLLGPAALD